MQRETGWQRMSDVQYLWMVRRHTAHRAGYREVLVLLVPSLAERKDPVMIPWIFFPREYADLYHCCGSSDCYLIDELIQNPPPGVRCRC